MPDFRTRLDHLIVELQRRRVPQVAAVYLVAAWGAIEVSDTIFPRLGMPDWTVTFVILLLGVLFPVVVALAWAFDLTRFGVRRTAPQERAPAPADAERAGTAAEAARDVDPPAVAAGPQPSASASRRLAISGAALIAVPLIVFGVWWTTRGVSAEGIDRHAVAIMPFRTAGASQDVAYLREGLMDLLAARVGAAEADLTVVPPRTVSRRIRDELGTVDADPDLEAAMDLARGLGAGLLLQGEVVGTSGRVSVSASLYDALTGERRATIPVAAPADSLHTLIDRLAAGLIAAEGGESGDRLAALTTASVPALREFMAAEQAMRRGQHELAVRSFDTALDIDSTFALAATGLMRAQGWAVGIEAINGPRAWRLASRGRDQLPPEERDLFDAAMGPSDPISLSELVDRRIRLAERRTDMPEAAYLAADGLLHYGTAIEIPDAVERAYRQFQTVIAMDTAYMEPLIHLHDLAVSKRDTLATRRYGDLILAVDSTSRWADRVRYVRTLGRAGRAYARPLDYDTLSPALLVRVGTAGWNEPPPGELVDALAAALGRAERPDDVGRLAGRLYSYGVLTGRPSLLRLAEQRRPEPWHRTARLAHALFALRDEAAAARTADELRPDVRALRRMPAPDAPVPAATGAQCLLGLYALATEDVAAAREIADTLGVPHPARDPWFEREDRNCAELLHAGADVVAAAPGAARRLEMFDDSMAAGTPVQIWLHPFMALTLAELWERLDRPERALRAVRRRIYLPEPALMRVELVGEEARLAERVGDREGAIRAYRDYIAARQHAEEPFLSRRRAAEARLVRLEGE